MKKKKVEWKRCKEIGMEVTREADHIDVVTPKNYTKVAKKKGKKWDQTFSKLFGIQTQSEYGMYAWDVEAVLERMASGRKTGSQLIWD